MGGTEGLPRNQQLGHMPFMLDETAHDGRHLNVIQLLPSLLRYEYDNTWVNAWPPEGIHQPWVWPNGSVVSNDLWQSQPTTSHAQLLHPSMQLSTSSSSAQAICETQANAEGFLSFSTLLFHYNYLFLARKERRA